MCKGIRLSEILRDSHTFLISTESGGNSSTLTNSDARIEESLSAFRCMAEAAWPVLVAEFEAKDSKLTSWITQPWIRRFIPVKVVPAEIRRMAAYDLIDHILYADSDSTWRGIDGFQPSFRRRMVLDLADLLQRHLKGLFASTSESRTDQMIAITACDWLQAVGTDQDLSIPALVLAARAGVPGARGKLASALGKARETSLASQPSRTP